MAMTIHCDIVSAEEEIFSGRVTMVSATGTIGELGIMPGHAPLLTGIRPGPVKLQMDNGEEEVFFASGGYLEVQPVDKRYPNNPDRVAPRGVDSLPLMRVRIAGTEESLPELDPSYFPPMIETSAWPPS